MKTTVVIFEISTLEFFMKNLEQKLLCLGVFGLEFEKSIVIFDSNAVKFFEKQSFVRK